MSGYFLFVCLIQKKVQKATDSEREKEKMD